MAKRRDIPVEVYCRLRPLKEDEVEPCAKAISDTVVQLTPPTCSLAFKAGCKRVTQHVFKQVFNENSIQKQVFDRVGFPLVEDLLQGKNGLLFSYGITNSGKTYTMMGKPDQTGVLPRTLDIIFNSISHVQAPRYVFQPDGSGGFEVYTKGEAIMEQQSSARCLISGQKQSCRDVLRIPEPRKVKQKVEKDNRYAVFVSYTEIYDRYVYDLLEDVPTPSRRWLWLEERSKYTYVQGVTEVEIKSTEEAFKTLYKGQKRRRVAQTQLNQESSRSHSVFNIRLVQAPLDPSREEVLQDKSKVVVSQLSLVVPVSERQGAGDTLVLKRCMKTLRDNQRDKTYTIVPYRDSKLTQLFKNYFDGEGKVRMMVFVSPKAEDYDESIHVMRFAEVTKEVVMDRPQTVKMEVGARMEELKACLERGEEVRAQLARKQMELHAQLLAHDKELEGLRKKIADLTQREVVKQEGANVPTLKGRKRSLTDTWLEDKPSSTIESGNVFQPQMKKKIKTEGDLENTASLCRRSPRLTARNNIT